MTMYTSHAERAGSWWVAQCDEVPGAISQVKRLNEVEAAQREAIAWVSGVPESSVDVHVVASITPEVDREIDELRHLRAALEDQEARAMGMSREIARSLKAQGYTVREIGVVLGVSHQRAQQLIHDEPAGRLRRA
ncbi:hypothetical protein [Leifsonia sp. NPDC077715]|uniref:hypothetical protein n=1 Tax=Leifsonia sp. NPDC077715 TaxID=3155539 RepID=UPI00343C5BA2